jgi:hypothetical protein
MGLRGFRGHFLTFPVNVLSLDPKPKSCKSVGKNERKGVTMQNDQAETIALRALAFLAHEEDLLTQFFATTGLTPQDLKDHFREPELLAGVLDAILADDSVLLAFCNSTSLSPETLILARRTLPGGLGETE